MKLTRLLFEWVQPLYRNASLSDEAKSASWLGLVLRLQNGGVITKEEAEQALMYSHD